MYSYEIKKLMEVRNWLIYVDEYLKICKESPQINHIQYFPNEDYFEINTDDRYNFKFKVRKRVDK